MATERSDKAWYGWKESSEKFDYFMAGLCTALTAYIGQNFTPARLGINASIMEVFALCFLGGSVVAAFKRIEMNITCLLAMHRRLYHEEVVGNLVDASQSTGALLNKATGEILSPTEASKRAENHKSAVTDVENNQHRYAKKAESAYRWRNRLLYTGFLFLVIARIWKAYI